MTPWSKPVRKLLSEADEALVIQAIRAAEALTSGEIRVHVEARCAGNAMDAAERWFRRLRMHATKERNGILFYIAVDDHAFAIFGDAGIHGHVGAEFWEAQRDALRASFASGHPAKGLAQAIEAAGSRLALHFPRGKDDRNELTDEISY